DFNIPALGFIRRLFIASSAKTRLGFSVVIQISTPTRIISPPDSVIPLAFTSRNIRLLQEGHRRLTALTPLLLGMLAVAGSGSAVAMMVARRCQADPKPRPGVHRSRSLGGPTLIVSIGEWPLRPKCAHRSHFSGVAARTSERAKMQQRGLPKFPLC